MLPPPVFLALYVWDSLSIFVFDWPLRSEVEREKESERKREKERETEREIKIKTLIEPAREITRGEKRNYDGYKERVSFLQTKI